MPKNLRNRKISDLKKKGASTLQIARKFGISTTRVKRIVVKEKQKERQAHLPSSFAQALPHAIGRILIEYWGSDEILNRPDIIVDLGAAVLDKMKRIGPKSLRKIAENLHRFDYIDDPDRWLTRKR